MISTQIEKTMKKALITFAQKEGKCATDISFIIHTKPTEKSPELTPQYFYAVCNKPVTEEVKVKMQNGEEENKQVPIGLRFTQDILGIKFDLLGQEVIAAQFLMQYFKSISESKKIPPRNIYISIGATDGEAKNIIVGLYKGQEVIETLKLEDVFGE